MAQARVGAAGRRIHRRLAARHHQLRRTQPRARPPPLPQRARQAPRPAPQEDHAPDVDESLDGAGRDRQVREAFAKLSKRDQDVITLCVLEELTTAQAAEALGVPEGTVKSRLSRARTRLATLASPLAGEPGTDTTILEGGAR
ncbi:RNA polymerase sigma factor [Leifsonia xyli]|uniref:RNA polymerase sigma factor n=1 Tax=Leifsonia xyli TaxID=1575 RepID=UPI003D671693